VTDDPIEVANQREEAQAQTLAKEQVLQDKKQQLENVLQRNHYLNKLI